MAIVEPARSLAAASSIDYDYHVFLASSNDSAQTVACSSATGSKECRRSKLSHVILVGASRAEAVGKTRQQRAQENDLRSRGGLKAEIWRGDCHDTSCCRQFQVWKWAGRVVSVLKGVSGSLGWAAVQVAGSETQPPAAPGVPANRRCPSSTPRPQLF